MKKLLLLIIFLPLFSYAQYDYLKLDNTQILFEKVYPVDTLNSSQIETLLITGVPKLKDLTDFEKPQNIIIAKIKNAQIDYTKYGGKWGSVATFVTYPLFADVSILWKDGKYKVTVNNIYFKAGNSNIIKCSDMLTKSKGKELDSRSGMVKAGQYIEKYLSDLFFIKPVNKEW